MKMNLDESDSNLESDESNNTSKGRKRSSKKTTRRNPSRSSHGRSYNLKESSDSESDFKGKSKRKSRKKSSGTASEGDSVKRRGEKSKGRVSSVDEVLRMAEAKKTKTKTSDQDNDCLGTTSNCHCPSCRPGETIKVPLRETKIKKVKADAKSEKEAESLNDSDYFQDNNDVSFQTLEQLSGEDGCTTSGSEDEFLVSSQQIGTKRDKFVGDLWHGGGTEKVRARAKPKVDPNAADVDEEAAPKPVPGASSTVDVNDEDEQVGEEEEYGVEDTYSEYTPAFLTIGKPHPDSVVQSASLASVLPPLITYHISLPDDIVQNGKLSSLQLEAVTYACQAHEKVMPSKTRAGYLIGDGAGVGKGRTIAGIILEN